MFITNEASNIFNPFSPKENKEYIWSNVSLRLHIPWFYIVYSVEGEYGTHSSMVLVASVVHLIDLNNDDQINIQQAYLVSPGYVNSTDQWRIEPIKEIFSGIEPEYEQMSYIYVLENGGRYVCSDLNSKEEELRCIKTVYSNS